MLAIIGGTGLSKLANLEITRREIVRTPYGEPSGPLTYGRIGKCEVVFLARHGYGHRLAPHEVNYRANVWSLHANGVRRIIAINSVGEYTNSSFAHSDGDLFLRTYESLWCFSAPRNAASAR